MWASTAVISASLSTSANPPHGGLVTRRRETERAVLGDVEQPRVRMVPGVARSVMGRRRQFAAGKTLAPVRLTLEVGAVTGRAPGVVDQLAER